MTRMKGWGRVGVSALLLEALASSVSMPVRAADPARRSLGPSESEPAKARGARSVPGFDTVEHRFGFAVGYAQVSRADLAIPMARLDYSFGWQGWGLGVDLALDLSSDGNGEELTLIGLGLRRNVLFGNVRVWAGAELGVLRLGRGSRGDPEAVLYHGTSSAAELGLELGRVTTTRPFLSLRADFPWYTTEGEALTPASTGGPDTGATLIDAWQRWTPVYSVWGGLAL